MGFAQKLLGGKGSGNFGHAGRPGERGGSAPSGSSTTSANAADAAFAEYKRIREAKIDSDERMNLWDDYKKKYGDSVYWASADRLEKEYRKQKAEIARNLPEGWQMLYSSESQEHTISDLPKEQHKAVAAYIAGDYGDLNEDLREGRRPRGSLLKRMDAAVGTDEAESDMTLYRAVPNDLIPSTPGALFEDKGFVSTSKVRTNADNFGDMMVPNSRTYEIEVPKGTKFLDVDKHISGTGIDPETEVILPRGSSFEVVSDGKLRLVTKRSLSAGYELKDFFNRILGGPGSGNFGHKGRPGERGGSAPAEEAGGGWDHPEWKEAHVGLTKDAKDLAKIFPWKGDVYESNQGPYAVIAYGENGQAVNKALRLKGKHPDTEHLDYYVEAAPKLAEGRKLYRGVTLPTKLVNSLEVGDTLSDKGYQSSTTRRSLAEDFLGMHGSGRGRRVLLEITGGGGRAAKMVGTAAHLARINGGDEYIWPRSQKFKIERITERDGILHMRVRAVKK